MLHEKLDGKPFRNEFLGISPVVFTPMHTMNGHGDVHSFGNPCSAHLEEQFFLEGRDYGSFLDAFSCCEHHHRWQDSKRLVKDSVEIGQRHHALVVNNLKTDAFQLNQNMKERPASQGIVF